MKISEVRSIIQIVILILTNGKVIVETIGEIVDEIKSWFVADGKKPELDAAALAAITAEVRPLMVAAKGKEVPQRKVASAVKAIWNAPVGFVKRLVGRKA